MQVQTEGKGLCPYVLRWNGQAQWSLKNQQSSKLGEERLWFAPNSISCTMPRVDGPHHSSHSKAECHLHCAHWPVKQQTTSGLLWSVFTQAGLGKRKNLQFSWEGTGLGSVIATLRQMGSLNCQAYLVACLCLLIKTIFVVFAPLPSLQQRKGETTNDDTTLLGEDIGC